MVFGHNVNWLTLDRLIDRSPLMVAANTPVTDVLSCMSQVGESGDNLSATESLPGSTLPTRDTRDCVLVAEENRLAGIFTERDVLRLTASRVDLTNLLVAEVMTHSVVTLTLSESQNIFTALSLMSQHRICHLPIVDKKGQLLGLVGLTNLLQAVDFQNMARYIPALLQRHKEQNAKLRQVNQELQKTKELSCQNEARHILELEEANKLLQQRDCQWQDLFDNALDAIAIADDEGRYVDVNPAACELFGLSKEELLHRRVTDFADPTLDVTGVWQQFLQQGQLKGEFILHRPDGQVRQTEFAAVANFIPHRHLSILRDITDRKQTEAKLKENEERLKLALETNQIGIWDWYIPKNKIIWSENLELLFGLAPGTFDGRFETFINLVHPEERELVQQAVMEAVRDKKDYELQFRVVWPNGKIRWAASKGRVFYDSTDKPIRMIGLDADITAHKELETALQVSETKLGDILSNTSASIFSFRVFANRDWEYEYQSPGCEAIYGYTTEEILADKFFWMSRVLPEDREKVLMPLFENFFAERTSSVEFRFQHKDGSVRWISGTYTSRRVAAAPATKGARTQDCWIVTGICLDTSDRKQAELMLKQQIRREQLIAEISQNIRQSLNLDEVLSRTVKRVREVLNTDRVIIFRFRPDWQGDVITESVGAEWTPILSTTIYDPCFSDRYIEPYLQGHIGISYDIGREDLQPCYVELLQQFQVKANLVVPILQKEYLWGLLIAHHCSAPRQWQPSEIDLLQQLATTVAIAIQQSEVYEQMEQELSAREQMQIVLEESEERFRTLSAAAPIGICQTNADGICIYTNARWQEMSGLSLQDSLGDGWLQAIHPEDRSALFTAWEAYLEGRGEFCHEFRLLTPKKEVRWISTRAAAMKSTTGEIIGYVSIQEDITEQKQVQEALQKSEQQLQAILDNSPAAIYLIDSQNRHLLVNRSYAQLLSATPESLRGKSIYEVWPTEIANTFAANNQQVLQENQAIEIEETVAHTDEIHTYLTIKFPLQDANGIPYAVCGISTDITERKLSEQKIREQATLIDVASDAIFVRDLDNRILFWNKGAERLYGWMADEVLGQKAHELFTRKSSSQLEEGLNITLEQGSWQGELAQITKTGKEIIVVSRWSLVHDESGQPQSILVVNSDITEHKQLEAQFYRTQRLESLGTLASGIAHDLNNILTPILGIAQLLPLQLSSSDPEIENLLKILHDSASRGSALVKQILSFAQGGEETESQLVQVKHLLWEVKNFVRQTFPKSIAVEAKIPKDLWTIRGDSTQLHQVLMNLCVNARDATSDGGTLSISAANQFLDEQFVRLNWEAKVGPYLVITVCDTGTGIPPEIVERIFDPFFTTKELGRGTGLGLSTVRGIIKAHGGFITVRSEVGRGSQFGVYLPAAEIDQIEREAERNLPRGEGELILLVDDEVEIREITKKTLETYNYRVLTASDGIEAIAVYAQHQERIDAVLLDLIMPEMDGLTAMRTLYKINPSIKMIAVSGVATEQKAAGATEIGNCAFLAKPYTTEELLLTLRSVISNSHKAILNDS
jgi:PAS domain S-box-containing protein